MTKASASRYLIGTLLLAAGAAQAAPLSVSEAPGAWYADRIITPASAESARVQSFPTSAYEHGSTIGTRIEARPSPTRAGMTPPFPSSPNESGAV
jgi:hypothetical protein